MHPHTSYIICATHRTGSTLLCEALTKTGLAGYPHEYFWRDYQKIWIRRLRACSFADYIDKLLAHAATDNGVFGAKLMWGYIHEVFSRLREFSGSEDASCASLLAAAFPHLRYVRITRRDKIRQAVSLVRAVQSKVWVRYTDEPVPPVRSLVYNYSEIEFWLERICQDEAEWQQFFDEGGITPFEIVYEDLIDAYEAKILDVLSFLEIPAPADLRIDEPDMMKQSDALSDDWLRRFKDQRSVRMGTGEMENEGR